MWFWTNHFTISLRRGQCAGVAGAFVEEAIRPHVTGRFADMLLAVMHHPAMLLYLDNVGSVGPDSPAGQRSKRGLNENLARECLELHTVSPAAGYTQADVTNFAKLLTGWSIDLRADPPGFRFRPFAHEPGEQIVMGRRFPPGEEGGFAALTFLADHPATHHYLATKLVCHFVADDPSPNSVRRIEGVLRDTRGNLGAAAAALTTLTAAWQPQTKLRTPLDFAVASLRALDAPPPKADQPWLLGVLAGLGQPMWSAPQPNGWPDRAADWAGPEALLRRIDWAYGFVRPTDRPRPRSSRRSQPRPAASTGHARRDAPRRLPPRRTDPAAVFPRIPEAMMFQLTRRSTLLGLVSAVHPGPGIARPGQCADRQALRRGYPAWRLGWSVGSGAVRRPRAGKPARRTRATRGPTRTAACWTSAASTACTHP